MVETRKQYRTAPWLLSLLALGMISDACGTPTNEVAAESISQPPLEEPKRESEFEGVSETECEGDSATTSPYWGPGAVEAGWTSREALTEYFSQPGMEKYVDYFSRAPESANQPLEVEFIHETGETIDASVVVSKVGDDAYLVDSVTLCQEFIEKVEGQQ